MPNRNVTPNPLTPELTYREMAEQLGIGDTTVELHTKKAIASFKAALLERGIDVNDLLD